jgi:hypothetical protein
MPTATKGPNSNEHRHQMLRAASAPDKNCQPHLRETRLIKSRFQLVTIWRYAEKNVRPLCRLPHHSPKYFTSASAIRAIFRQPRVAGAVPPALLDSGGEIPRLGDTRQVPPPFAGSTWVVSMTFVSWLSSLGNLASTTIGFFCMGRRARLATPKA